MKVWPLKTGLKVGKVEMKAVEGLEHKMPVSKFGVSKPSGCIESLFVSEVERVAGDILGLYSVKEHEAMLAQFGCEICINRILVEMGIEVDVHSPPARKKGKETVKSEVVAVPKAKVPQPLMFLKTRTLELRKRKVVASVGTHQKESGSSKKKNIVMDEGIPSSSKESEDEGTPKVDESTAEGKGKLDAVTELASSRLFFFEEYRASDPFMLELLAMAADAGEGYNDPPVY